MSKRKASESRQPGIETFLSKSKRTEGSGGSDKATSEQRPEQSKVLNDEIQDLQLEDELFTQEQVFKKLLVNMCTPTDDSSDCEDGYEDDC